MRDKAEKLKKLRGAKAAKKKAASKKRKGKFAKGVGAKKARAQGPEGEGRVPVAPPALPPPSSRPPPLPGPPGPSGPDPPRPDGLPLAPLVAADVAPPRAIGGWEVITVEGGWLRYNAVLSRCDAHCNQHGQKCKMDRVSRKMPVGIELLWLSRKCENKTAHDGLKVSLAVKETYEERRRLRGDVGEEAAAIGGTRADLLKSERETGGTEEEPLLGL